MSTSPPFPTIRDTLFGDAPLEAWTGSNVPPGEPWSSFVQARQALATNRVADAVNLWQRIAAMPDLESRHYLQAWHFLRAHGVNPPPEVAKQLLGVVIEVPMNGGLDLLAAYPDRHARYYNYSGRGVIWEHSNASLDPWIDALLAAGSHVVRQLKPISTPRPPAPSQGNIRINLLSPEGLHLGEGPFKVIASDPGAKPTFDAATALMTKLVALDKR
jgi:hypothetical protein